MRFSVVATRTGKTTPSIYLHKQLDVTQTAIKDKVLVDYADTKVSLADLPEKAHQLGTEWGSLAAMPKSDKDVANIALELYWSFWTCAHS